MLNPGNLQKPMDLRLRNPGPELMDAPEVDAGELRQAMAQLEVINSLLNGYGPTLHAIQKLLPRGCTRFSLLDVGCGNGDTLRQVAKWAAGRRIHAELYGIELCADTAEIAAMRCALYPEIRISHTDLFEMTDVRFDLVHCALMLHHFPQDADAAMVLRQMGSLANMGVIVNDLHRNWFAYHAIRVLTRLFSNNRVLQHDAPLSVARGFRRGELDAIARGAGLAPCKLQWHWAFRWLLYCPLTKANLALPAT